MKFSCVVCILLFLTSTAFDLLPKAKNIQVLKTLNFLKNKQVVSSDKRISLEHCKPLVSQSVSIDSVNITQGNLYKQYGMVIRKPTRMAQEVPDFK